MFFLQLQYIMTLSKHKRSALNQIVSMAHSFNNGYWANNEFCQIIVFNWASELCDSFINTPYNSGIVRRLQQNTTQISVI